MVMLLPSFLKVFVSKTSRDTSYYGSVFVVSYKLTQWVSQWKYN